MSDERAAGASRLTELAQGLNRIDAARYPAIAARNLSHLPPHLIEKLSAPGPALSAAAITPVTSIK